MNKEKRFLPTEFRFEEGGRWVEGYACVFNTLSRDLGGFFEVIDSKAFDGVLENSDVLAVFNHDDLEVPLARYRGTNINIKGLPNSMELAVDETGLKFRFEVPKSNDSLLEAIQRRDIDGCSFSFTVDPKNITVKRDEKGRLIKTITKINRLYDCSPVSRPAYEETNIDRRSIDEFIEAEAKSEHERIKEEFYKRDWKKIETVDGLTSGRTSREIVNGFIITTEVWGYDKDGDWKWDCYEEYFQKDPLTGEESSGDQLSKKEEIDRYYNELKEKLASV